ncbi:hypothetical protein [Aliarcobacter butzleri]|uniref:hypothetical protein n=1 Tax=Aliarcobacter butzleri TaxID=28197 RepID=UPI003AF94ADA
MSGLVEKNGALRIMGINVNSIEDALKVADYFAKSDLVPKDFKGKPGNVLVAWQKGVEVGLMPQQALESIAVINGRASMWGDAVLALVKNSPKEEWTNEWIEGEGDNMVAYCETKRANQPKTIKRSFSVEDAKKAGLWGANTWAKYPKRMLSQRARGFTMRDAYPEVLNGIRLVEEEQDYLNTKYQYIENIDEVESAIKQLGLSLSKNNNIGTIVGKTFGKENILKELGFNNENGFWLIRYKDLIDAEIIPEQTNIKPSTHDMLKAKENSTSKTTKTKKPFVVLYAYLSKSMEKDKIKTFVNDVLGLTRDDEKGINEVLADLNLLDMMVNDYISSNPKENNSEEEKTADTLF